MKDQAKTYEEVLAALEETVREYEKFDSLKGVCAPVRLVANLYGIPYPTVVKALEERLGRPLW